MARSKDKEKVERKPDIKDPFSCLAFKTVTEGRPTKGMPTWGDSLSPGAIREIVTFLESVQN